MGAEVSAWLDWLLTLPGVVWAKAAGMDATAWAGVQAIGSILAILAGFGYVVLQNWHADVVREAERVRRAEVVAYGLSGWIAEIGIRIDQALAKCQERLSEEPEGRGPLVAEVILEIVLGMEVDIDASLPDLHFLNSGSGDIAQLNYFAKSQPSAQERRYWRRGYKWRRR